MDSGDRQRIVDALEIWVQTKTGQQLMSQAAGRAQGGTRGAVTGGRHLAGVNQLILDELDSLGLQGLSFVTDHQATVPGYYRASKNWDLIASVNREPTNDSADNQTDPQAEGL